MSESTLFVPDGHKRCTRRSHIKALSEFGRQRQKDGTHRPRSWCKECVNEASRDRYESNPEWRAYHKVLRDRWREENPTYMHENYMQNREQRIANAVRYAKDNPPDPERRRELGRIRYAANPEKGRAKWRTWQADNADKVSESRRRSASRRRARRRGLPTDRYTIDQLLERDGIECVLCGEELDLTVAWPELLAPTVEHLECFDWPTCPGDVLANVAVSHWDCNNRRRTSPHPAAARKRAELLAVEQELIT